MSAATATSSTTATATAVETTEVNVEIHPDEDLSIERLFVNLDVSNRTELGLVGSTIQEIYRTVRDTTAGRSLREVMKDILVIAFKRRNHKKSQADGEGAGEKAIFLEVLLAVLEWKDDFQDLVEAVLPLVPIYGSWRDLAVLAEEILIRPTLSGEGAVEGQQALHPIAEAICQLFAKQLQKDFLHKEETTPSNACKYCPHECRHREKKEKKREREEDGEGEGEGGKRRKTRRGGRVAVSSTAKEEAKAKVAQRRRANSTLAHRIAALVSPQFPEGTASSVRSAAFRRLRAALNQCLTVKGHLVEPRLCDKDLDHIDFIHANKGSLTKYTKAIKRDETTAARWKALMKKDARAIPDLDDLLKAAKAFLEGETDSSSVEVFKLQLKKAVQTVGSSRQALLKKAKKLLEVGGYSAEDIDAKLGSLPSLTILLDTTGCEERNQRLSLWLAAYLLGRALGQIVIVDGEVVDVSSLDEESWDSVCPARPAAPEGGRTRLERALELATTVTSASAGAGSESSSQEAVDVLFLCQRFQLYEQDADMVHALLDRFQARDESNPSRKPLRSFRVHRVLHSVYGEGEVVTFAPRKSSSKGNAERDPCQTSADLLFVVDFTGSMGSYMDAVKANLLGLITELQTSTRLKHVRVGFVGYRDYNDEGRVVTVPFCDQGNVQRVLDVIRDQHASGGGDAPEDLLSAFVAAGELEWESDIRIQVIITDANAHGVVRGGDSHPTGRCPDQSPPYPSLEEALTTLAEPLLVDTLFCKLNQSTEPTQRALYEVYQSVCCGQGFGTISMETSGADSFREKVLAAVSEAILGSLTQQNVSGLQSADGVSVSAVTGSMNAFLRESFSKLGISLASGKDGEQEKEKGESDWERLQRELQLEELQPVRLALQMSLPPGQDSLSQRAANALYQAGLTVEALEQNGYPDPIIESYRSFIHSHLQAL